jgi:Domain of unknown function (DUF4440)
MHSLPGLAVALAITACASGSGAPAPAIPSDPTKLAALLRAQTQELLDAVSNGDPEVWERYLDPQMLYLSEAGDIETKATLLPQLQPLPAGISGKLEISRFELRQFGDTAVTLHVDEEHVSYFGHALHAQYMTTGVWKLRPDGWKLISQQVHAALVDPPTIELPAAQLDEYVGTYALNADVSYTIRREGARLVGQRTGRDPQPLLVEVRDVLFVPGQPRSRKIFLRDPAGKITRFADRREARDIPWIRR